MGLSANALTVAAAGNIFEMIALSVNLNKIALLRNSRYGNNPSVINFASMAIKSGANGITVHPRPDLRHILPSDIDGIKNLLQNHPNIEFNIEGNPFSAPGKDYPGFLPLIEKFQPHQCTLVPDNETQLTSDHGFNLLKDASTLKPAIKQLRKMGVRISLFMDPEIEQISRASELEVDCIELYTGPFAEAYAVSPDNNKTLTIYEKHCQAAEHAHQLGLIVNAGHDLNLQNLQLYRALPHLNEVSIGHALTIEALQIGFAKVIDAYIALLNQ